MKLVKLSLVAAIAAGAFSVANAAPLEEVLKDIDVSGVLRYRYDTGTFDKKFEPIKNDQLNGSKQQHKYRAQINFSGAIADNFKAFMQLDYSANDGGYGAYQPDPNSPQYNPNVSNTSKGLSVRQLYLTYTNDDFATSVIAGKQQLNTIWTDNDIDGLVGTGIKVVNNSIDGITLAAFAVDSTNARTEQETDTLQLLNWEKNIYGGAALASYNVFGGDINSQLWLAYMSDTAFLYALDVAYSTTVFDGVKWTLEGAYLGNSVDNSVKGKNNNPVNNASVTWDGKNNNFFALRGTVEFGGWDATLGGLYYGKKDGVTITVLEDQGNLGSLLAGEEIFYTDGSRLSGDYGQNTFGYVTAGYTFNETVRVGGDFIYGGTKTDLVGFGGDKMEAVARVNYKYSPKLDFSAFYSYLNVDRKNAGSADHNTVRLQALYKF
ncbi:major outer membrane protein [Campylobacter novaezeelandiae]|uniref:major outer membrane protein n=1 Tax=Campylobacter novaezeelandiae TaxID=2267891 RepID=UPI0019032779|nr:major outer membrane protein [Campylobacter novaezeelandiae]MBK1963701.1 major outer membrane protein [Campylobacter novaezeelandiae]MBK1992965.1 major outer membrane protein [Campylobacter novaezeelandiae]